MPVSRAHDIKDLVDVLARNIDMKEVTHGVDEHPLRLSPLKRTIKHLRLERHLKPISVAMDAHGVKAAGHSPGIAVLTAGAGVIATRNGVPRRLGPLDRRLSHIGQGLRTSWAILTAVAPYFG